MIELPKSSFKRPDVIEAIDTEKENMDAHEVFGERVRFDDTKEVIGSRLVITESQKHDGQKKNIKS